MEYLLLLVGFVLLIKGADIFVDGSSAIATLMKIPQFIIGLTIVSFGTSAPEAAVSISAGISGSNEISIGNVIGSNIFNLLMVVGVCSIISNMNVEKAIKKFDFPFSIALVILTVLLCAFDNRLDRLDGIILIAVFAFYMFKTIRTALKNKVQEEAAKKMSPIKSVIFIVLGLFAVVFGGDLVVDNAVIIAGKLGMSETLIALTIVAMGTSLPELVTSIVAAKKGENGLALGNVVGSNIFNFLFVLAASVTISPIAVKMSSIIDMCILVVVSIVMLVMILKDNKYTRPNGIIAVAMYAAYTAYIFYRNYAM